MTPPISSANYSQAVRDARQVASLDTSVLDKKTLKGLGKDGEVYVSKTGHLVRKEDKQVGGKIGKLLGFKVKTVFIDLKSHKTLNQENVQNASKSKQLIINFLKDHIRSSLSDIQPAPIETPKGVTVQSGHIKNAYSDSLYKEVNQLKLSGETHPNKSLSTHQVKQSITFIKSNLEGQEGYRPPQNYANTSRAKAIWHSINAFFHSSRT